MPVPMRPKIYTPQRKVKKGKKIKIKDPLPDTSKAQIPTCIPLTKIKAMIDVEEVIKKDKEVKEKDVFDFSYQKQIVKKSKTFKK
jgi:hypothetical protein